MNAVVNIRQGKLRGSIDDGVKVFKGIPYASPPLAPIGCGRQCHSSPGEACEMPSSMARRHLSHQFPRPSPR